MSYPDGNPKTAVGATKVPLHLVPPSAIHYLALAFKDGAAKYGPYNWREQAVSASVYFAAMKRHEDAWWDGEDLSPDAMVEHLAHVMACCAIILDAASVDMLNDDRPTKGASSRMQAEYVHATTDASTPHGHAQKVDGEYRVPPAGAVTWLTERGDLPPNLAAAILRDAGIGDVPRHPMSAEADRIAEDRL